MTKEGYDRKMEELNYMETVKRPEISRAIAEARDKGDLSENAEYDAAKEAQGLLEMKIAQLKELVANARIIDESKLTTDEIQLLSRVRMRNVDTGSEMEYTIVADSEADTRAKKIAISTPIARGLLGHKLAGEIPSYRVAEDEHHYAFLDINPLAEGHVLVVPKHEVDYIFDLPDDEYAALTLFAKRVAKAQREAIPCKRIAEVVLGLEVPHAHIHLIPINSEADVDFRHKLSLAPERMAEIANAIAEKFEKA